MGDAWSRQVHPDMEIERRQQPFDVERLTNFLDGGAQSTALRRKVGERRWGGASGLCSYAAFGRRVLHEQSHLQIAKCALMVQLLQIRSLGL